MAQLAVTALGRDRPGIVAAITETLVRHGLNIADSQSGILSGRFSMVLIVDGASAPDVARLEGDLRDVAARHGLDAVHVHAVDPTGGRGPQPTHVVSVYGVDHPGIVHAVARELARRDVNITDLSTRRIAKLGDEPLYAMLLEVQAPAGLGHDDLQAALRDVAASEHVDVAVRELDADPL